MAKINFFLRFPGTCEEAFKFYQSVFGGELFMLQRFKEMIPHGFKIEKEDEEKIAFVTLKLGKKILLGGDDYNQTFSKPLVQGNNVPLGVSAVSKKAAEKLYEALSEGGTEKSPLTDMYWGDYTGSFIDKFGVPWSVIYHHPRKK
jgi:PhnB protein